MNKLAASSTFCIAGFRERCIIIIPTQGEMQYKLSAQPIKITDKKTGKTSYGYHLMPLDSDGNPMRRYPLKKRLDGDLKKAIKKLAQLRRDLEDGKDASVNISASAFFTEYKALLNNKFENRQIQYWHYRDSVRHISRFEKHLTERTKIHSLREINTKHIDEFLQIILKASKQRIGKDGKTKDGISGYKAMRRTLNQAFEQARKYQYIKFNPVSDSQNYKRPPEDTVPFTISTLQKLINVLDEEVSSYEHRTRRNLILTTAYLGSRCVSLRNVTIGDLFIDGQDYSIFLRKNKDGKTLTQPLVPLAVAAILDQIENLTSHFGFTTENMILFSSPSTQKPLHESTCSHWVSDLIEKYFKDDMEFSGLTFRSLRAFVATEIAAQRDPETSRMTLNHRRLSTTIRHYIKPQEQYRFEQARKGLESIQKVNTHISSENTCDVSSVQHKTITA